MKNFLRPLFLKTGILGALVVVLFGIDAVCYAAALPLEVDVQDGMGTLHVGSQVVTLGRIGTPVKLGFALHDEAIHEYQIDGTDSTNNFTLNPGYIASLSSSPYYRFWSWMRDLDGTSRWRDLQVRAEGQERVKITWPSNGAIVPLPSAGSLSVSVQLQRPEIPMTLDLITADGKMLHITLDRNNRKINVTEDVPGQENNLPVTSTFFPVDAGPFVAMVVDTVVRVLIWALVAMLLVVAGETIVALVMDIPNAPHSVGTRFIASTPSENQSTLDAMKRFYKHLTRALHPIALAALLGSLVFVAWIARVQYSGEPHIYDASAYLFAAKMYARGHLSVPIPQAIDAFPGGFMLVFNGQWFGQYAPGTALTLVPGIWLGVPWLVEPVLGTLALLGIGLIAARLYDRRVASLAVLLGAISPFYSYLAASYLSHAVALFYLVWGLWTLLCFAQGKGRWYILLSALLFGMAGLTRDLVALLFVAIAVLGVLALSWERILREWRRWMMLGATFLGIGLLFVGITLWFNATLTGNPWESPRALFFAGDRWGFGQGIGFYGQHTIAAGFVNLDELLTSLQIDLFGWPFYFTLAFLAIPFLTWRARRVDWLMLAAFVILTGAYVGYFYHGIYLGPRYLFEALPFLLILTARGILTLAEVGMKTGNAVSAFIAQRNASDPVYTGKVSFHALSNQTHPSVSPDNFVKGYHRQRISVMTVALVGILIACNLLYFLPRQIQLHTNYTGLPYWYTIDVQKIYRPPTQMHHAIVVTDDYTLYQFILFPLNDPLLRGDVIYAWANSPAQYTELRKAFPGRVIYQLKVDLDGGVQYSLVTGIANQPGK